MNAPDSQPESFADQYDALLTRCGYVSLADWTVVALTGSDRQSFLHNMCTNEISKLAAGEGCEAFFTDVKGKIVAHAWVVMQEYRIVLLTVPNQAEQIVNHLDRYIIREDVQLVDRSQAEAWTLIAGKQANAVLGDSAGNSASVLTQPWQSASCQLGDIECLLVRFALPGRNAFLLGVSGDRVAALHQQLGAAGAVACGPQAWDSLRVEAGLPLFGTDFDHSHLPQEVARDAQAISFTKGCYLGQETVARIDALGQVTKQLVTLKFAEGATPEVGSPLLRQDQQVGVATTVGQSGRSGGPLALAMVRRGSNEVGATLDSPAGAGGRIEVIATPAFDS
jgi:folate-binding protein YgfZ